MRWFHTQVPVPKAQLPLPPAAQPAGACGAPAAAGRVAQEHQEEQQQQAASGPAGVNNDETTCVPLASIPVEDFVQLATSSDASDWEDVAGGDQKQPGQAGEPLLDPALAVDRRGDGSSQGLTIVLHQEHQRAVLKRGRSFTKADRERAALVHRCHLLCLLGRGLLLDAAASQPLLQALLLSLVPPDVGDHLRQEPGQHQAALDPVVGWFKAGFRLAISSTTGAGSSNEGLGCGQDEIDEALQGARGVDGLVEHLQQVVERRCGTVEELGALFVAVLRAHGFVVRLVRSLHPIPLKPADAQRQMEQSQLHLARSCSHAQRFVEPPGAAAPSAAAAAATSGAAAAGRQAVSPASPAGGQTRTPSTRRGASGRGTGPGRARGRGTGAGGGTPELEAAGGRQAAGVMAGRGPKRRKPAAKATGEDAGQDEEGPVASLEQPSKRRRAPARGEAGTTSTGAARRSGGDAAVQEHVVGLDAAAGAAAGAEQRRKRKCDEEEEHQIALALAATAFEASSAGQGEPGPARATGGGRTAGARPAAGPAVKRSAVALPRAQSQATGAGAAYSSRVSEVGSCWAEVLCGPPDKARWVHVDPLTGWIDREGDVESLAPRGQPLTYVVAFAGGGAKDVTSRYSRSLLAAEKLRDSKWWEATLRPLRAKEVAATLTAAAGAGASPVSAVPAAAVPSMKQERQQGQQEERPQQQLQQESQHGKQQGLGQQGGEGMETPHEAHRLAAAREDADLAQRAQQAKRGLPTTIDGFKSHPVYVLERHIAKYQGLRPEAKKCGLHRGESYYLREHMAELHTAERWRREGREVEPSQLGQPAKRIKKRAQGKKPVEPASIDEPPAAAADGDGDGDDKGDEVAMKEGGPARKGVEDGIGELTCLYGVWQTKPWAPPAAAGGKVPRNERGNVEAPPFAAALPVGTVHLRLPSIAPVCRKLQVDFAPALVGFDARGGRMVPRLDGVVICQEFESLVLTTYLEEERQREERARQKREEEAEAAWRQLLRALLTRVRLQQDYGQGAPDGSVMGEAAAELLRSNRGQDVGRRGGKAKARREANAVVDLTREEAEQEQEQAQQPQQQQQQQQEREQGVGLGAGRGAAEATPGAGGVAAAGGVMEGLDYEEI
ncbi:hypothetical protein N2152v2_009216 [Parachlorella kessleri]